MSIKSVIVFGAHGLIGQHFVRLASSAGLKTTAVIRNSEQAATIKLLGSNIATKNFTVDEATVEEISKSISGNDAVVITVGSRGKNLLGVDLDGVVKVYEASTLANVRRLVLISAAHAEDREWFSKTSLHNYYIAKHYADRILQYEFKDKLDFTILKPTRLTDGASTGKIKFLEPREGDAEVHREDVAQVILNILDKKATFGKSYDFANGDKDIDSSF